MMQQQHKRHSAGNSMDISNEQMPQKPGGVIYYDTELKFSPQRLLEILLARYPASSSSLEATATSTPCTGGLSLAESLVQRVDVRRPLTCKALNEDLRLLETTGHLISEGIFLVCVYCWFLTANYIHIIAYR